MEIVLAKEAAFSKLNAAMTNEFGCAICKKN